MVSVSTKNDSIGIRLVLEKVVSVHGHILVPCKQPKNFFIEATMNRLAFFSSMFFHCCSKLVISPSLRIIIFLSLSPPTFINVRQEYILFELISLLEKVPQKFLTVVSASTNMICRANCVINLFLFDSVSEGWWK